MVLLCTLSDSRNTLYCLCASTINKTDCVQFPTPLHNFANKIIFRQMFNWPRQPGVVVVEGS